MEVWADHGAMIRIANVKGNSSLRDLSKNDVGENYYELVYWPNPPDPIVRAFGRVMSDLEIQAVKNEAAAWLELERLKK